MATNKVFRVELQCTYKEWWRYNVELQCGSFDADGQRVGFTTTRQTVAEIGANLPSAPDKTSYKKQLLLESVPCHEARFLIYIIPHTLPKERRLEQTPPFDIKLRTWCDGAKIATENRAANQWSGTSFEITLK